MGRGARLDNDVSGAIESARGRREKRDFLLARWAAAKRALRHFG